MKSGTGAAAPTRTIQYDARGNTVAETRPGGVGVTTAYDGYGRLTQYTRGTVALSFQYNGRDDRVAMTSASAGVRRYVYDPAGRVIGEYGFSAADVKAEFIWLSPEVANDNAFGGDDGIGGYAPLAVATPDSSGTVQLNWVHPNHLGVPLVTTDASGNPATTLGDYLAPGFPGQARVLADLYYNRYRDYDPTTGRYIQADPIGLAGGGNPYLYAGGNPMGRVDPMGLEFLDLLDGSPEERALARHMKAEYDHMSRANQDKSLYIAAHGSRLRICPSRSDGTFCLGADAFARQLKRYGYLKRGRSITLWACDTGTNPKGFAQLLANATGTTVFAPNAWTWWNDDGLVGINPQSNRWFASRSGRAWYDPGRMVQYDPVRK